VERVLDLHKRLAAAATPNEKDRLQRQIGATDGQVDQGDRRWEGEVAT
jgi:hypothetical protein